MYRKRSRNNWEDKTTFGYSGKPEEGKEVKDHISVKSLKDLPKSSYALKADPYDAALPTSEPYPILNKFNRVVGGNYDGEDNLDGGNVQQYANSTTSKFLKAFDEMRLKINANYRYLPILSIYDRIKLKITTAAVTPITATVDGETFVNYVANTYSNYIHDYTLTYNSDDTQWEYTAGVAEDLTDWGVTVTGTPANGDKIVIYGLASYPGIQLIDEMRKSIAESVSIIQSTTFTQMAINNFAIETDLPLGSAKLVDISTDQDGSHMAYTNLTDVLYGMAIYYQLVLQNSLNVMNWHNSFRLKQGTMVRNAWGREVPSLNAFFGLMNKKAFLSMLNSINLSFEGEYVDKDFMTQMNLLTLMPSRRSNSISDPVLELQCGFNHPTVFKVYALDNNGQIAATIFDDADMKLNINFEGTNQDVSFWEACDHLRDYLSMEATQKWARSSYTPAGITGTDRARYNQIIALLDVLVSCFTLFKPSWADFREAFDVMVKTGTISWSKGFRPSVINDTDATLFWNVLTDHVYQFILSGAQALNYDEFTKRWRTFSLWNMYSGIPSYDVKSGGAFLSLSFKEFGDGIETSEQYEYLPLIFDTWTDKAGVVKCVALARDGKEAVIVQHSENIDNNVVLSRLAPLVSQNGLAIRVPTVAFNDQPVDMTKAHFSALYKTLTQIFGTCRIQSENNGSYDTALDPDILAIYQIEINDITNMAITYARANAPFRGTTSDEGKLGFAALTKGRE